MTKYLPLLLIFSTQLFAQPTPLEKNKYEKLTSYDELTEFIYQLDESSQLLKVDIIGKSVEGRNLYALKFSNSIFGEDTSKIKVLIFAQQHGNEQSGKEGALLLSRELLKTEKEYLFDKIDLALIPQMNPDGSEINVRRNFNGADLNRNHLILTEPETIALHKLFDTYLFEATMDVHEYYPYTEDYINYGYVKYFDEQVGTTTNPNVSIRIRRFSNDEYLTYIKKFLNDRNFSFHNYIPGGPPEINLIRHSTYDINDGRQSLGIQNSFSFIQEGKNGRDSIDNIQRRAEGQAAGMMGFLLFIYENVYKIKSLVKQEREKLILSSINENVAMQMDHIKTGEQLNLTLHSLSTDSDTVIIVNDYRPVVNSIYDVKRPLGYLIPKSFTELYDWAIRQNLTITPFQLTQDKSVQEYYISGIDSIDFEGDTVVNPNVELREVVEKIIEEEYYFIPTNQIKNNLIVTALEPKSILGLVTYKQFAHLLKANEYFPVLRVVAKK
ncbi:MAG: hypothetical protein HXY48_00235 [Ignavibacteriaceae bacterium]|nr:hypothetical protein [Ignavibacteriaceae bacterium]